MRTKDALMIGYQLGRIQRTLDAWEESKHKRDKDGKFTSGGGSAGKMPKNLKYNKGKTDLVKKANSPEHWMNKKEAAQENAVKKFKEQIKNGTISEKEKRDLAEGRAMVKSGEWTKNDYERQIRGIAISKMENEKFSSKGGGGTPTKNQIKNATYALSYAMNKNHPEQVANRLMSEGVPEKAIDPIIDEIVKSRKERYDHKGRRDGWMLPEESKKKIINMVAAHMTDED